MKLSPLFSTTINSPLGTLYAVADDEALVYLGFDPYEVAVRNRNSLHTFRLQAFAARRTFVQGKNHIIETLEHELELYFKHKLTQFTLPLYFTGSAFQKAVWSALLEIPYGHTRSYKEQALKIDKPGAYRAVGTANGENMHVIVVPCHRIINSNGKLGGYSAGLERKEWLLKHEAKKIGALHGKDIKVGRVQTL